MASNADWFARRLQGVQPSQPLPPLVAPSQTPMTPMPTAQPAQDPARLAQSASLTDRCPDCGSTNYFAVQNAQARCYDCGYPISQSGSKYGSLSTARVEGGVSNAQGNNTASNWNPQGIIGRIN